MNQVEVNNIQCANPKCDAKGLALYGRNCYCGECLIKVKKIITEKEEEYILRNL